MRAPVAWRVCLCAILTALLVPVGATKILKVRVSTVSGRYAAVTYGSEESAVSKGSGFHPALAVDTVVALYRNHGTELACFYRDPGGWGIVDADLAVPPVPDAKPLAVSVKGTWDCG
jgi:hypothetical protein